MAKDFFDEEFEKIQQDNNAQNREEERKSALSDWYTYGGSNNNSANESSVGFTKKPWYIVLCCIALVLAMVLGWVLCSIFTTKSDEPIIATVLDYLENNYYQDVPDEKMQEAIAAAGTALLQTAGDKFCQLMSPQTYYDFINQTSNVNNLSGNGKYLGILYSYSSGLGLYVSEVYSDSSCYGLIFPGDIILKITDISYDSTVIAQYELDLDLVDEIVVADYDSSALAMQMVAIDSANFVVLRNSDIVNTGVIKRGTVGYKSQYDYQFIEFYFDKNHRNISTRNQNFAKHNTYELRGLNNLPSGTGYIRLKEFMYYYNDKNAIVTVADEFREVMSLFKSLGLQRLILDLKGNPGGLVDAVCDIAGMLVTDSKLTDAQKSVVENKNKLLITSLVPKDSSKVQYTYRTSTYDEYFGTPATLCDIVVWTDGNSASASELLTGALSDYGTGFQIGEKTYGKGIAQTYTTLPFTGKVVTTNGTITDYNWAIYYTFAAYYSPLGTNIHGKGYTPDDGYSNITDYVTTDGSTSLWDATYRYWGLSN